MKVVVTGYIDAGVARKFDTMCKENGWSKSRGIEQAIKVLTGDWNPEVLPDGYKRGPGGKLLKKVTTRTGQTAWKEVADFE